MCCGPLRAFSLGSKWSCLLLRFVLHGSLNEVLKVYPPLNLKVFVDDITADMEGQMRSWLELQRKS